MSTEERIALKVERAWESYQNYLSSIKTGFIDIQNEKVRRELDYRQVKYKILNDLANDLGIET